MAITDMIMDGDNKVEGNGDNLSDEKVRSIPSSLQNSESKDFAISEKFLQSVFKYDNEAEERVWRVDSNDLPALVQVVRTSMEKHDSRAFSICDGNNYLWNSCFICRDKDVTLNSVVRITSLENVKTEDYDKDDYLERDSVFDDVLAIAEFDVVCEGMDIGHCLWDIQSVQQIYVLSSGAMDCKDHQLEIMNNRDLWDTTSIPEKCDVRFEFIDGQVVHAHKHVLREKSSVFEAHFDGERVFADQKLVKITDANCRTFSKFLKWIYGFNIQFESLETMMELVYLSDKYIVGEFLPILRNKVRETLDQRPHQAVAASNLNSTGDADIANIIFGVIDKHIELICRTGEIMKWDNDTIEMVTARKGLNIDEYQLLQYLFMWMQKHAENKNQVTTLLNNIKFEEIHKSALKNFLESDNVKAMVEKDLLDRSQLENHISLRIFKNTSLLEKRVLFSQDHASYSTYRSTEHFTSDDPSTLPPVIFPLSLTPDNLTSFPMVILNDNFTLVQPNLLLKSLEGGNYSLECLIRINGAVSGLPDMSVFRQADYFRHVSDIQARVELHYSTAIGWGKQEQDLTQRGLIKFKMTEGSLFKGVLSQNEVFRGCLVVRQFKSHESSFNTSKNEEVLRAVLSSDSESEPEGEDIGYDDDENEQDEEEDGEELDDFIQDEEEVSGEEEEAPENVEQNELNNEDSASEAEEALDVDKESTFSSDEEVVKKPRYQNKKEKTRRKLSSEDEDEEPRSKKRKRVIVDSESEEEEKQNKELNGASKHVDSESEESEYETDDEMGKQTETDNPATPEACFSGDEDQPINGDADSAVEKDNIDESQKSFEVGFSTDDEDSSEQASSKKSSEEVQHDQSFAGIN